MTDNEIIKALNYCCGNIKNNDEECNEDMCYQVTLPESRDEGTRFCRQWLIKDALDLINRQNAEIERLEKKANTPFAKFTFDENKLKEIVADAIGNIEFNLNSVKSEAIKEFAERLKEEICCEDDCGYHCFDCCYECKDYVPVVDKLVKEMT